MTRWCAWFDWANAEHLALEQADMTPALRQQLALERTEVRTVEATDRHAAVRAAFPELAQQEPPPAARASRSRPRSH